MAKFEIFSIYDCVESEYDRQLFLSRSRKRAFRNMDQSMDNALKECEKRGEPNRFEKEDYKLYAVGSFDSETGEIKPQPPVLISTFTEDIKL